MDVPQFSSPATTWAAVRMFGVTYATAGLSALIASASSVVSVEFPVKIFAPLCEVAPGKIMMKFEPREAIVSWIDFVAPLPIATTTMTQPTPMTMPSIVRNDRILLREIAFRPTIVMLPKRMTEFFIGSTFYRQRDGDTEDTEDAEVSVPSV